MKWLLTFVVCFCCHVCILAQQRPADIDKIPLPPGFIESEGEQPLLNDAYREELSGYFENPEKAGKYKSYALKTTAFKMFMPPGNLVNPEMVACDFYFKQLCATNVISNSAEQPGNEPDISGLNRGEGTSVVFYPSGSGGGIFKWYFNDGDVKVLTVTVGSFLLFVERTFAQEVPVVVPAEKELGFPLYPGAEFRPLKSIWRKGPGGFGARKMVFQTTDALAQIKAYFESKLGQKGTVSSSGYTVTFTGSMPDPGTYQFSTLTINMERQPETGTWNTWIEYYYPYP